MANSCWWEDEDGWRLLKKWHHLSLEISVSAGGIGAPRRFTIKSGLITVLDPTRIRFRGRDGSEVEMELSESEPPFFEDVVSAEIMAEHPEVKGVFPEMVSVSSGSETWRFVGPVELDSAKL